MRLYWIFFIINEKMRPFLKKMTIDEDRIYCLSNYAQYRKNERVIETDHNAEILELNIQFSKRKPEREEIFNLKNKACQEAFYNETEIFQTDLPFQVQSKFWLKHFNSILYKCFRKIRIVNNRKKDINGTQNLMTKRIKLQKDLKSNIIDDEMKLKIKQRIIEIENDIGNEVAEENVKEVVETLKSL